MLDQVTVLPYAVTMTRNFIPGIDDEYKFTRPEFAKLLGISTNALRMRMRNGHYGDLYVRRNGKFFFKRPRPNKMDKTMQLDQVRDSRAIPPGPLTKKRNRGNHFEANYPNQKFKQSNELKMLAKLQHNISPELQELLPEAVELAKKKKAERISAASKPLKKDSIKNYGDGLINLSNKGYNSVYYHDPTVSQYRPTQFQNKNRPTTKIKKYYW